LGKAKEFVCKFCGFVGKPKKVTEGSFLVEIFLWLLFLLPGVIYSIWRMTTRKDVCPKCGKPDMIPVDTPEGQKLAKTVGK